MEKSTIQRAAESQNDSQNQAHDFGEVESYMGAQPSDDALQRKQIQQAANESGPVQQLKALQAAANNSQQVQRIAQLQAGANKQKGAPQPFQHSSQNKNGLPEQLKLGIESLSGINMDAVRVHYNSSKPAEVQALAYASGNDIYLGPGQSAHLPHEAWHIVQQKQGRVKANSQAENGANINDDANLEHEADVMGAKAMNFQASNAEKAKTAQTKTNQNAPIQRQPLKITDPTVKQKDLHMDTKVSEKVKGQKVPSHVIGVVKGHHKGSKPSISIPGWSWLENHVDRLKGNWVRFHLINEHLGGPGDDSMNLVPTTVAVNNAYERSIESKAKKAAKKNWTYIEVKLTYGSPKIAPIPTKIEAEYGIWNSKTQQWETKKDDSFENPDLEDLEAGLTYIRGKGITQRQLKGRGVPSKVVKDLQVWLQEYRQKSANDYQFLDALEKEFGDEVFEWIDGIWLDEVVDEPKNYQPVLKSLPSPKRKRRDSSASNNPTPKKKRVPLKKSTNSSSSSTNLKKRKIVKARRRKTKTNTN